MTRPPKKLSNWTLALIITMTYVILGTIHVNHYEDEGTFEKFLFFFFIPVEILPGLLLWSESKPTTLIIICQTINCLILWPIIWLPVNLFRDEQSKKQQD